MKSRKHMKDYGKKAISIIITIVLIACVILTYDVIDYFNNKIIRQVFASNAETYQIEMDISADSKPYTTDCLLSASVLSDGYRKGDIYKSIKYNVHMVMDDTYLQLMYNKIVNGKTAFPTYNGNETYTEYLNRIDNTLLAADTDMYEPISISIPIRNTFYGSMKTDFHKNISVNGYKVGEWFVSVDKNGKGLNYILNVRFNNAIYARRDMTFDFSFDMEVSDNSLNGNNPSYILIRNSRFEIETVNSFVNKPSDYEIKVNTRRVNYRAKIESEIICNTNGENNLDNCYVNMHIPAGLTIDSVALNNSIDIGSNDKKYSYDSTTRMFSYRFDAEGMEKASISISFNIDEEEYFSFITASKKVGSYSSIVNIMSPDGHMVASDEFCSTINLDNMVTLDGYQEPSDCSIFHWQAKVYVPSIKIKKNTYFIALFNKSEHSLKRKNGIKVIADDKFSRFIEENQIYNFSDVITDANGKSLSTSDITEELIAKLDTDAKSNAFTFVVKDNSDLYEVLVVPFNVFVDKDVFISYDSCIYMDDITMDQYALDHFTEGKEAEKYAVEGEAGLIWMSGNNRCDYNSPLYREYCDTKAISAADELISCYALNYNEKTQKMQWKLSVNGYRNNLKKPVISIKLDDKQILDISQNIAVTYAIINNGEITNQLSMAKVNAIPDREVYVPTYYYDGEELRVYLPDINEYSYMEIYYTTRVVDKTILTTQNPVQAGIINCNASISASIDEIEVKNSVEVSKNIVNSLIKQSSVGDYNVVDKTITWQVTVNPNNISYTDGYYIVNSLGEGQKYGKLTSITRISKDGKAVVENLQKNIEEYRTKVQMEMGNIMMRTGISIQYVDDTLRISPENKGDNYTYIFTFTTVLKDEYVFKKFVGDKSVVVEGKTDIVFNSEENKRYSSFGKAFIENYSEKTYGMYFDNAKNSDTILWSLNVNNDYRNLTGSSIYEKLQKGLVLDKDSITFYENEKGFIGRKIDIDKKNIELIFDENNSVIGFKYVVQNMAELKKPFIVIISTNISDDRVTEFYNNFSIIYEGDNIEQSDKSNQIFVDRNKDKYLRNMRKVIDKNIME